MDQRRTGTTLSLIVAMDRNGLIGRDNGLPWRLPADLKFFKKTTLGKPVIMGRKTFESIGKPLPGRLNIVVTRNPDYSAPGCTVVASFEQALRAAGPVEEAVVIGGAALYERALADADRIYLTEVQAVLEGDTWFPQLDATEWQVTEEHGHGADDSNAYAYTFKVLERAASEQDG